MVIHVWERRMERGLTLKQLSAMSGVGKSTISSIENGEQSPLFETLEKLARAMNVKMQEIVDSDVL